MENKTPSLFKLKKLYKQGVNLGKYMRDSLGIDYNTPEIIKKAYDARAGMDVELIKGRLSEHIKLYSAEIAKTIESYINPASILEAGVGEGTTLLGVAQHFNKIVANGFDLSPKRIKVAKKWLKENGVEKFKLRTGNLLSIPYKDNTFDVVYTSHAIEPNGGKEEQILKELYRVAKKYLFLLEPGYELTIPEYQKRMESLGFIKDLKGAAERLGYNILKHELFPHTCQIENPTAILIIKKEDQ